MMTMFALADLWKPLAIAALLATVAAYRVVLIHQRDAARAQAAKLSSQVAELQAGNQALSSAIVVQNAAVAELKAEAARAAALAHSREQAAAQAGAGAMDSAAHRAAALSRAPIEPGCEAAIRWGNGQAGELGRW